MENREVARILRETAQLLEIDGAMIGRYRSYERVAELLDGLPESIEELARDRDKLMELPGIGDGMADHIQEILKTGDYSLRTKAAQEISGNDSRSSWICSRSDRRKSRFSGKLSRRARWSRWKKSRAKASCAIWPASEKRAKRIF